MSYVSHCYFGFSVLLARINSKRYGVQRREDINGREAPIST